MALVQYGIRKVYYSTYTVSQGTVTYGTPTALPGAVSINLDITGEPSTFWADDSAFVVFQAEGGYEGTLELASIDDNFYKNCLGYAADSNGVLVEESDAQPAPFALLFEIEGNEKDQRFVFYNCVATRPTVASETTNETTTPRTISLPLKATNIEIGSKKLLKASLLNTGSGVATQWNAWFSSVYTPTWPTI